MCSATQASYAIHAIRKRSLALDPSILPLSSLPSMMHISRSSPPSLAQQPALISLLHRPRLLWTSCSRLASTPENTRAQQHNSKSTRDPTDVDPTEGTKLRRRRIVHQRQPQFTPSSTAPPRGSHVNDPRQEPRNPHTKASHSRSSFREIPKTERIPALDTLAVTRLFAKRLGSSTVASEGFNIKCTTSMLLEPTLHVSSQTHRSELGTTTILNIDTSVSPPDGSLAPQTQHISEKVSPITPLLSPSPGRPQPPPAYRVSYILSKKQISKLAVHRNLLRKKLSAAVEKSFRSHARPGYDYLVFAKQEGMRMTQEKLVEQFQTALKNPRLYGERDSTNNKKPSRGHHHSTPGGLDQDSVHTKAKVEEESQQTPIASLSPSSPLASLTRLPPVTIRWKNNQPPAHQDWWKHAEPHPLGRTQQHDLYLNQFAPDAKQDLEPIWILQGRRRKFLAQQNRKKQMSK